MSSNDPLSINPKARHFRSYEGLENPAFRLGVGGEGTRTRSVHVTPVTQHGAGGPRIPQAAAGPGRRRCQPRLRRHLCVRACAPHVDGPTGRASGPGAARMLLVALLPRSGERRAGAASSARGLSWRGSRLRQSGAGADGDRVPDSQRPTLPGGSASRPKEEGPEDRRLVTASQSWEGGAESLASSSA